MSFYKEYFSSICFCLSISACSSNHLAPYSDAMVLSSSNTPEPEQSQTKIITAENNNPSTAIEIEKKQHDEPSTDPSIASNRAIKSSPLLSLDGYFCQDAQKFIGSKVGDGECVDLIKNCTGAPLTRFWKPGDYVFGNNIPSGTAIATFRKGKYPNRKGYHAAIYSHQDENGIYAWDQWKGKKVHLRYIKADQTNSRPGNNASRYQVILR